MAGNNQRPIIIKKVKKVAGHGHHGGAWKVAYADFVTAMMAFFLLMWLINTTTPEQKRGIADYFAPASVSQSTSGSGGILGGTAMSTDGARSAGADAMMQNLSPQTAKPGESHEDPTDASASSSEDVSEDALDKARSLREQADFASAEQSLRQAMQAMPELAELSKQLIIDQTPEGLRIQIVDQEGRPMFNGNSSEPTERARKLLKAVAGVVVKMPNRLSISGHTDATEPPSGKSNWEVSSARADAARRLVQSAGIPQDRIYQVAGKAESEPLFPDDPYLPGNRRISIVLLRESPVLPSDARP
ncbi:MAG: flagellar motor protein MotB [Caulobacterales bacterium]